MTRGGRVSRYRRAAGTARAQYYASRRGEVDERKNGNFISLMLIVPLATFAAVFLWDGPSPSFAMSWGEPSRSGAELRRLATASEAELARERWPTTARMLDGAQPGTFPICDAGDRANCVVDGDTFWYRGEKIRIADINTPETNDPGCPREAALGAQATERLQDLLNAGKFQLGLGGDGRDSDRYGRKLRTVNRGGESLGDTLVEEGLAERWKGSRSNWC